MGMLCRNNAAVVSKNSVSVNKFIIIVKLTGKTIKFRLVISFNLLGVIGCIYTD